MITISLCMIVKNEEKTLEKCLESVKGIVDEVIIIDTGSTDLTKKIARKFTDKIFDFSWVNDFSAARNYAFEKASQEYILWLDADDIFLTDDRVKLKELKQSLDPAVDAVMMKYNTGFDLDGNVTFSYYRERLVRSACHFRWHEPVHEYLKTGGRIVNSDVCVTHTKTQYEPTGRNIAIYEDLLRKGEQLSARGLYYFARELKDNGRLSEAIRYFNQFLDCGKGWVEDNITACLELSRCYEKENQLEKQFQILTRSFVYDTPRAEICCHIGYLYKKRGDFGRAAFWFQLSLTLKEPEESWGFIQADYWGYIPSIELAVCYDRLHRPEEAEAFNELAGKFKTGNPAVEFNRKYFADKRSANKDNA